MYLPHPAYWRIINDQRKNDKVLLVQVAARLCINEVVEKYAPPRFKCPLHETYLEHLSHHVSDGSGQVGAFQTAFLSEALEFSVSPAERMRTVETQHAFASTQQMDEFVESLRQTLRPSPHANEYQRDENTRIAGNTFIDTAIRAVRVAQSVEWEEENVGNFSQVSQTELVGFVMHGTSASFDWSPATLCNTWPRIRSIVIGKYDSLCTAAENFLPPRGRGNEKGQGWALHLGFLAEAYHRQFKEMDSMVTGMSLIHI